jgi:hypothetical protein
LASVLAVPSGQALDPAAAAGLQKLGPISFDLATFHRVGGNDATVVGTVTHPPSGTSTTWTFVLSYVSGSWLIVDASPVS